MVDQNGHDVFSRSKKTGHVDRVVLGCLRIETAGAPFDVLPVDPKDVAGVGEKMEQPFFRDRVQLERFAKRDINLIAGRSRVGPNHCLLQCRAN